jgi:hypothetical protein
MWKDDFSNIKFPTLRYENIETLFYKEGTNMRVDILVDYVRHSGFLVDISKYKNADTYVVLTNSSKETILYLNAGEVAKIQH